MENDDMNKPDFYTAFGSTLDDGEVAMPEYASYNETGVLEKVLAGARREGFKGTAAERMVELGWRVGPVYTHLAATAWEPLTPERLEKLKNEPLYTKYWLACKQYEPEPVIAAIQRNADRVYFSGEDDIFKPDEISHIMPFITPEMPKA